MNADATLRIPEHVVSRQVGDETVILDLASGTYFGLDPVGARAWQLLGSGTTPKALVAALLLEYDVEQTQLEDDIRTLVETLIAKGLVVTV